MIEQESLFGEPLPVYQEDLERIQKKQKAFQNDLCTQLNRLMTHFKQGAADIHRGTGVSFSTLGGWINGNVEVQLLDDNIKKVARYFGISVDYLAFSVPMSERDHEIERAMEDEEDKQSA